MKKTFLALCAAVLAFAACQKETPFEASLVLNSDAAVTVPQEGGIYTVDFTANEAWTASIDAESSVASLSTTGGSAADGKIKVTVQPFDEENGARTITLTIKADGVDPVTVVFSQSGKYVPYFTISEDYFTLPAEGGTVSFSISTNTEFTVTAEMDSWLTYTEKDGTYTFTAAANTDYGTRAGGLIFTIPAIQDDVYDDEGNVTGDTIDHTESAYVAQEGLAQLGWLKSLDEKYAESSRFSEAVAGGYIFVCNGSSVVDAYSAADGSYVMPIDFSAYNITPTGITSDDAGNILISTGGAYLDTLGRCNIYVLPVAALTDASKIKVQVSYINEYYGVGLDNVRASGNVYDGDGVITMISGGSGDWDEGVINDTYVVAFEIKGGAAVTAPSAAVKVETSDIIWVSGQCVACALGTKLSDGLLYMGYDGSYDLRYNATAADGAWQSVLESGSSWAEGYNAMDVVEWNGHKYVGFLGMAYFPYWGMPTYLWLVNVDDPTKPVVEYSEGFYGDGNQYGESTDISLVVNGNNLEVYIIDGEQTVMGQYLFGAK